MIYRRSTAQIIYLIIPVFGVFIFRASPHGGGPSRGGRQKGSRRRQRVGERLRRDDLRVVRAGSRFNARLDGWLGFYRSPEFLPASPELTLKATGNQRPLVLAASDSTLTFFVLFRVFRGQSLGGCPPKTSSYPHASTRSFSARRLLMCQRPCNQ